ncbi:MAG: hypothetical protein RL538_574 [Candidatus Parcubacteria bacterium]|jgi:HAD superfamily hydrolase (TIGR01509 family)
MANLQSYKAVIFDLDGVLVDMREAHFEALNLALMTFGERIGEDEHEEIFNGLPSRKKLAILASDGRISTDDIETINAMKQDFTKQIIPRLCTPDPSKIELIEKLRSKGVKIACCTNSLQDMAELMLETAGLLEYMEFVIGNDSVTHPKPDPEMYQTAMERLGISPEETIIVEDSLYGIAAARASGATVVEVTGVEEVTEALLKEHL